MLGSHQPLMKPMCFHLRIIQNLSGPRSKASAFLWKHPAFRRDQLTDHIYKSRLCHACIYEHLSGCAFLLP